MFVYNDDNIIKEYSDGRKEVIGTCPPDVPYNGPLIIQLPNITHGTFTDIRDGHIYKTVEMGKQVWMAENLNYYAEGLRVYKKYEDNPKYGDKYGLLYDWDAARKVCPGGWHLPSNEEWLELIGFVGGNEIAGKELKAKSGFAALLGGYYHPIKGFNDVGNLGYWWSSSEIHENRALYYYMSHEGDGIGCSGYSKMSLYSVRCVKNL